MTPLTFGELDGLCRKAYSQEEGYGMPPNENPRQYATFRDGFYAGALAVLRTYETKKAEEGKS